MGLPAHLPLVRGEGVSADGIVCGQDWSACSSVLSPTTMRFDTYCNL